MRGKYSPTVNAAYMADQKWWDNYSQEFAGHAYPMYDPEGYDRYGYDKNDVDRAGNHENSYAHNDGDYEFDEDYNNAYNRTYAAWGFDGTKPIRKI